MPDLNRGVRVVSRPFVFVVPADAEGTLSWSVRLTDFAESGRLVYASMIAESSEPPDPSPGLTGDVVVFEGYGTADADSDAAFDLPTQHVFSYTEAWLQAEGDPWTPTLHQIALAANGGAGYGVRKSGDLILRATCEVTAAPGVALRLHLMLKAEVY